MYPPIKNLILMQKTMIRFALEEWERKCLYPKRECTFTRDDKLKFEFLCPAAFEIFSWHYLINMKIRSKKFHRTKVISLQY